MSSDAARDAPLVPARDVSRWLAGLAQPVAVTGGTGFVGSHLVDTLCDAGLRPRVLLRDPAKARWIDPAAVEPVAGSLDNEASLAELVRGAGTIFHLAGVVRAARADDFDRANRLGTARLVTTLREYAPRARLVHVSSLAAAGPSPEPRGVGPEAEPRPFSAYGCSKLAGEREVTAFDGWWTVLRPPAIYGPRDTDILEFFKMAAAGWLLLPTGERFITVAFVGDVVKAILAAAVTEPGRIFHLGEPEPYRMDELLRLVASSGGLKARIVRVPAPLVRAAGAAGSCAQLLGARRLALTADKVREILARHWTARTRDSLDALGVTEWLPFAAGAGQTWTWYRARGWIR